MVKSSSLKLITLLTAPPRIDPGFLFFGTTGATTIVQLPLAFVCSGWVNVGTEYEGVVRVIGYHGYGWARTAESSTYAYRLNANPTYIGPLDYVDRWSGFPIR